MLLHTRAISSHSWRWNAVKSSTQPQPLLEQRKASSRFYTFTFVCLPSSMFLLKKRLWWVQDELCCVQQTLRPVDCNKLFHQAVYHLWNALVLITTLHHFFSSLSGKRMVKWLILKQLADKCFGLINCEK